MALNYIILGILAFLGFYSFYPPQNSEPKSQPLQPGAPAPQYVNDSSTLSPVTGPIPTQRPASASTDSRTSPTTTDSPSRVTASDPKISPDAPPTAAIQPECLPVRQSDPACPSPQYIHSPEKPYGQSCCYPNNFYTDATPPDCAPDNNRYLSVLDPTQCVPHHS